MFLKSCRKQFEAYRTYRSNRKAHKYLCQLNDHLLHDIGLNRLQIATFSNFETASKENTHKAQDLKTETAKTRNSASVSWWRNFKFVVGPWASDKNYS